MRIDRNSFLFASILAIAFSAYSSAAKSEIDAAQLIANSDCIACHAIKGMEQRIGPPFDAIALRYKGADAATIDQLAKKIEKGGGGAWGIVPMVSHPQFSRAETEAIVRWILSQNAANPEVKLEQLPQSAL